MADGHLNKCKECTRSDSRVRYRAKANVVKAYDKARAMLPHRVAARKSYQLTDAGRESLSRSKRAYISRNPEKRLAHIAVGNAIRDGKLTKQPCEVCKSTVVHAHHDDYSRPLLVRWLCPKHHVEHHHYSHRESQTGDQLELPA